MDFWNLIQTARGTTDPKAPSTDPEALRAILEPLSDQEIEEFVRIYYSKLIELNRWSIWGAGYVASRLGMGDDAFHYFRSWIIGKGEACFNQALANPDGLVEYFAKKDDYENELLEYVGIEILESRGNENDPRDDCGIDADHEPTDDRFDEDEFPTRYPMILKWKKSG